MITDDDRPAGRPVHGIGEDLSNLSVDEIDRRVAMLEAEIARLQADRARKVAMRQAADAVFKRP